jgi:hypothetical protein
MFFCFLQATPAGNSAADGREGWQQKNHRRQYAPPSRTARQTNESGHSRNRGTAGKTQYFSPKASMTW